MDVRGGVADVSPMFSVVIPTYNAGSKVVRAVESVLDQSETDYELLVIDDGSVDGTADMLSCLGHPVHYVRQRNAGTAAARNRGLSLAAGKYVAFLDADDRWYNHKLQRVAQAADTHPDVALFHSRVHLVTARGERLWTYASQDHGTGNYRALLHTDFVMTSSVVVRRDVFASVGGFDPTLTPCEDWDMWIRIARQNRIMLIREPLVAFEYMSGNSQTSATETWIKAHDAVMTKVLAADTDLSEAFRRRVRSAVDYRKAKVYLAAGDEANAMGALRDSVSNNVLNWQAWLYLGVLRSPALRRRLPKRLKWALRLPESLGLLSVEPNPKDVNRG